MIEILLIILVGVGIYIYLLLKKILDKLEFQEKFYCAFDTGFVEKAHVSYKRSESKYEDCRYDWQDKYDGKNFNDETEKILRKMMEAEIEYKREEERYFYIIDGNIAVMNGVKKISDVLEQYNSKILDTEKIFNDIESIDKRMNEIKNSKKQQKA